MAEVQISIVARQKFLDRTLQKQRTNPTTINGDVKLLFRGKREVWKVAQGELLFVIRGQEQNGNVKV